MKNLITLFIAGMLLTSGTLLAAPEASGVRIKDLGRIAGIRDNSLVGYGLTTGLAGTGDSARSKATLQSISNMLKDFGLSIDAHQLYSRNVAAVMVTATLPPFARPGDKLDVNVSSLGDARSLVGGTLLLTPLYGPDKKVHALVQGQISVGGFKYDMNGNIVQKNHPTSGNIPEGAIVESDATGRILKDEEISILLYSPDYTTSTRVADKLNETLTGSPAKAADAGRIFLKLDKAQQQNLVKYIATIENLVVEPDQRARVVINERTGMVVSGGDVRISKISVTHGDTRVTILTDYEVSQPSLLFEPGQNISTAVVPRTRIDVKEAPLSSVSLPAGTTVSELVTALNKVKTNARDVISILQGIRRAGALHAELIIQ